MDPIVSKVQQSLRAVIYGKNERIDLLLAAFLARGHILIEDMPGLGKTTLAKALAKSVDATFRRIQFTPDLLPSDVLGGSVFNPKEATFDFHEGPLFTNILLADEINRASPRTQSSLLEAMGERQATIEGVCHVLPDLFIVIATQNPIEFQGTYPLPEAQLDRFLIQMELGYAHADVELNIIYQQQKQHPLEKLQQVASCEQIVQLQTRVCEVHVDQAVGQYIVALVRATREQARVKIGVSPRGSLGLFRMAQAVALMDERDHVRPEDVQQVAVAVLAHRLILETKARYGGIRKQDIIEEILKTISVPI